MISIRSYTDQDAEIFQSLNLAWIEQFFVVEAEDREQLQNPRHHILDQGGRILIAERDGEAVGTVGLLPLPNSQRVELIKMSARADVQGLGIGKALMQAALSAAREMGAQEIWLETNSKLSAAMHLYKTAGFRQLTAAEMTPTPYDRCNCQMLLKL